MPRVESRGFQTVPTRHNFEPSPRRAALNATLEMINLFSKREIPFDINGPAPRGPVWEDVIKAVERHHDPGSFRTRA